MSKNSRQREAEAQAKADAKRHGARGRFKIISTSTAWSFAVFSFGAVLNYFGSNPRILYLPAFALCCLIMFITHGYISSKLEPVPLPDNPSAVIQKSPVAQPDYVPGTTLTYAQLREIFPFGYTLFIFNEGTFTYRIFPSDKLQWASDWERIEITPDFSKNMVTWRIPQLSASITREGKVHHFMRDIVFVLTVPIQQGRFDKIGLFSFDQLVTDAPYPFVGTLSANQRSPIFIMGFRIPPTDHK